ncbi:MAG: LytTR family DNA-binding domain-containing protein [Cyclobacteriaceae bacterium]|jgi:DNA-binding LytR/AlgR family response regulator|nr:LytTR family DNA-binding domain-containing protein [Cyclobacteriaceae bacterium]
MMRCLAVDDEKWALDLLVDNIRQVPYLQLVAACRDAAEAARALKDNEVDLIFLDVQMPGLSGLQFIRSMPAPPMVILVTAYERYALEGFNLSVVDYLLKPVSLDRFVAACSKAKALYDLRHPKLPAPEDDHFFVNVEYSLVKVVTDDILYVEGLKDYIKIHVSTSQRPIITRLSLKAIEDKLPSNQFARVHKSYIISIPKVTAVKRQTVCIGTREIPVSESYRESVSKIIGRPLR